VKAVLLYAYLASWTITQRTLDRLQVFISKCLIINVHWPDRTSNNELWKKTVEELVQEQL